MVFTRFTRENGHYTKTKMRQPFWAPSSLPKSQGGHTLTTITETDYNLNNPTLIQLPQLVTGRRRSSAQGVFNSDFTWN